MSSAGEIFFFLSGLAAALANHGCLTKHGCLRAQGKAVARCGRICKAHVAALLAVMAITIAFSRREGFEVVFKVYGMRGTAGGDFSTVWYSLIMLHQLSCSASCRSSAYCRC